MPQNTVSLCKLYGKPFQAVTDHKSLEILLTSKALNRHLHGFVLKLQEHELNTVHRKDIGNSNAMQMGCPDRPGLMKKNDLCDANVGHPLSWGRGEVWNSRKIRDGPMIQRNRKRKKTECRIMDIPYVCV